MKIERPDWLDDALLELVKEATGLEGDKAVAKAIELSKQHAFSDTPPDWFYDERD